MILYPQKGIREPTGGFRSYQRREDHNGPQGRLEEKWNC